MEPSGSAQEKGECAILRSVNHSLFPITSDATVIAVAVQAVSQGVTYLVGDVDGAQVSGGGPGGGLMSIESLHLRGSESSSLDVSGSVVVNACGS